LTRALWLKKIWKGRSKGVSSVIGTVFLILVVFAIATNVFLWTISQSSTYNQAVKDANQKNADRINENVIATQGNYTVVSTNKVKVEAQLTNAGSVATQIINLWVFDTSKQTYGFNDSIASMSASNLNPGQVWDLTGTNAIIVTVPSAGSLDNFNAWFVTARGNTVPVTVTTGIIVAQVSQGIGSVAMDFGSFVYYNVTYVQAEGKYILGVWPNGKEGFYVPKGTGIAFRVMLTNFDPNKRTIQLNSHSALWTIFPTDNPQQVRSRWWYIVNVNGSGTITSKAKGTFSTLSLNYGQSAMIYFASYIDLSVGDFQTSSIDIPGFSAGAAAVNLMLFGKIGTSTYGQNIPFVSVYVT